jgi:hypothetical protein
MQLSGVPAPAGVKPKMHKIVPTSKDWSLKATYVEVVSPDASTNNRYITMNSVTYSFLLNFETKNVFLSPYEKIQKAQFS